MNTADHLFDLAAGMKRGERLRVVHPKIQEMEHIPGRGSKGIRLYLANGWYVDAKSRTSEVVLYEPRPEEAGGPRLVDTFDELKEILEVAPDVPAATGSREGVPVAAGADVVPLKHSVLGEPIEILPLSTRAVGRLQARHYALVGDLAQATRLELLTIRHFGTGCLEEVEAALAAHGLSLRSA